MVNVVVVDDSAFVRTTVSRTLNADPRIKVVGVARNGAEAVERVKSLRPDVVTLDIEMPEMDGLTALEIIMKESPTPVVMLSSLTGPQTDATIRALELGAVDFFLKASVASPTETDGTGLGLARTVRLAASVRVGRNERVRPPPRADQQKHAPPAESGAPLARGDKVVVIGASTGGPRALGELFAGLPSGLRASFLVVQHMPAGFTASLAVRLDENSEIRVREAADGDRIRRGAALLAPGGYHMQVKPNGAIELNQGERVHGVRPSVDVTMHSAVESFGGSVRGIVLTGMGADGTDGSGAIRAAGGNVAVEHESTCAVYGMPRSVAEAGHADDIVSLPRMARQIAEMCR